MWCGVCLRKHRKTLTFSAPAVVKLLVQISSSHHGKSALELTIMKEGGENDVPIIHNYDGYIHSLLQ